MTNKFKDVTDKVIQGDIDGSCSYITKCVCGEEYGHWNFIIINDDESLKECPKCGRKFYFEIVVKVLQLVENEK